MPRVSHLPRDTYLLSDGEVLVPLHIVDVDHRSVQGYSGTGYSRDGRLEIVQTLISITRELVPQSPVGGEERLSNQGLVLLDDIRGRGSREEVHVQHPTDCTVDESGAGGGGHFLWRIMIGMEARDT